MAQITVAPVIPVGTTGVAVYPRSAWGPRLQGAPSGSATASSLTVASDGTVTATLTAGTDYVAYRSSPETFVAHSEPPAPAATGTGNQTLFGRGAPASGTGNNGDTYVDTLNRRVYGQKAAGAWPSSFVQLGPLATSQRIRAMSDYVLLASSPTFTAEASTSLANTVTVAAANMATGNITSGSNQVTSYAGGGQNGQIIYGAGIPQGTTILSGGGTATLTLSANATATTVGVSLAVLNLNVPWRAEGADLMPFITGGVAYAVTRNPYNGTNTPPRVADPKWPFHLEFDFDGQALDFNSLRTATATGRVWIDEQLSADWSLAAASTLLKIDQGAVSRKHRRWVIEVDTQIFFSGITYIKTDTIAAPEAKAGPKLAVVGDSFAVGGGIVATQYNHGSFAHKLARRLGVANYRMYGQSGTGLLAANAGVGTYRTRIGDVTGYAPDLVFIQGSINDGGQTAGAIQTELETYLDALKAALPSTTQIAACSPVPVQNPSANEIAVNTGMKAACGTRSVPYLDFITSSSDWLGTGTGRVAATTGDGNADFYHAAAAITSTGHPTQGGHDLRERALAARLATVWGLGV